MIDPRAGRRIPAGLPVPGPDGRSTQLTCVSRLVHTHEPRQPKSSATLVLSAPGMARPIERWAKEPGGESRPGSDLGVGVPWGPWVPGTPS